MGIDLLQHFSVGQTVVIELSNQSVNGIIQDISSDQVVLKLGNDKLALYNVNAIVGISENSSSFQQPNGTMLQTAPTSISASAVIQNTSPPALSDTTKTVGAAYVIFKADASQFDIQKITPERIKELEKSLGNLLSPSAVKALNRIINSLNYALTQNETDMKFGRLQSLIQQLKNLYDAEHQTDLLLLIAFLYQNSSDKERERQSLFADGIRYINPIDHNVAIHFMAANGTLPDVLEVWNLFVDCPALLVHVISKGFTYQLDIKKAKPFILEIGVSFVDPTVVSTVLYSLVGVCDPQAAARYASLSIAATNTRLTLQDWLNGFIDNMPIQGYIFFLTSTNIIILTESLETIPCKRIQSTRAGSGDFVRVRVFENEQPAEVFQIIRPSNETELRQLLQKLKSAKGVSNQHNTVKLWLQKRLGLSIQDTLLTKTNKLKEAPQKPQRHKPSISSPTTAHITRLVQGQTGKSTDEVIKELENIIENSIGEVRLTAIKNLIMYLNSKAVNNIDLAVQIIRQNKTQFTQSDKIPYINLSAPILEKAGLLDEAVDLYFESVGIQPKARVFGKIALLYIQKGEFAKAIEFATKALHSVDATAIDEFNANSNIIVADIGLGQFDQAMEKLGLSGIFGAKYQELETLIAEARNDKQSSDALISNYSKEASKEDYYSPSVYEATKSRYLAYLLERCTYRGIFTKLNTDENGLPVYRPESISDAQKVIASIIGSQLRRYPRDGKAQKDRYELAQTIARISEYCLENASEEDLASEEAYQDFIKYSAVMLTSLARHVSNLGTTETDYVAMLYSETLRILAQASLSVSNPESGGLNKSDFYFAFNSYITYSLGRDFATQDSSPQLFQEVDRSNVVGANCRIESTVIMAFSFDSLQFQLALIRVLFNAADAYESLKRFLCERIETCKLRDKLSNGLKQQFNVIGDSLETVLSECVKISRDNRLALERVLNEINSELRQETVNPIRVETLANTLSGIIQIPSNCALDLSRIELIRDLLQDLGKVLNSNSYEAINESYNRAINNLDHLITKILENPSALSFEVLQDSAIRMKTNLMALQDSLAIRHLPALTFSDDESEQGYPSEREITIQLRIENGPGCTAASGIRLDFLEDDETKANYVVRKQVIETQFSLAGGSESGCVIPIKLMLTQKGQEPENGMLIRFNASYRTVYNDTIKIEKPLELPISIQRTGAYYGIKDNPYVTGAPLDPETHSNLFMGRDDDIEAILGMIANKDYATGQSIAIYGQYRSGKTSLMNFLERRLIRISDAIIIADWSVGLGSTLEGFVFDLVESVYQALEDKGVTVKSLFKLESAQKLIKMIAKKLDDGSYEFDYEKVTKDNATKPDSYLRRFLKALEPILKQHSFHMIFMIDEFGRVFTPQMSSGFMGLWKEIMQMAVFDAIVVGHDVITEKIRENVNEFASFRLWQLNYLPSENAKKLIQNPVLLPDGTERFKKDAVDYILWLTACNPSFIQHICARMVEFMNSNQRNRINKNYVNQVVRNWLTIHGEADNAFHPLYKSGAGEVGLSATSEDEAKMVLSAIAKACDAGFFPVKAEAVLANAKQLNGTPVNDMNLIRRVLDSLVDRWVVKNDPEFGYEIRVKLYQEYLLNRI
jgi:tetratricopeptide (TPR) repeat protein